jgi:alkanesulfonate monooxygenase
VTPVQQGGDVSTSLPRFGIWALVHGSRGAQQDPDEPFDASWTRNRKLILEAESLGYDSVLVAQHTVNPNSEDLDQLEAWTASAALAALTDRIEIIAAIKPLLYHPVVLAKMALQIETISNGRFSINLVNAWNRDEIEKAGIAFPEHDARYAYGTEWLDVVEPLLRGEKLSYRGQHFHVDNYMLRPADAFRPRPQIYIGGESQPAQALAANKADVWFINGQPLPAVARLIENVSLRPRTGPKLRFGLSAFVIARESEAEAQQAFEHLLHLAAKDAPLRAAQALRTDPNVVMKHTMAAAAAVGTNGGTAAGLVGTYDDVAARIHRFGEIGIETFMLQFQPFEAGMRSFAHEIMPRVRRLHRL